MNQKKKSKKIPILRNNFLNLKSQSFNIQKGYNKDRLKIKTNSIISQKSSNFSKNSISILNIINDSKLFDSMDNKICSSILFKKLD